MAVSFLKGDILAAAGEANAGKVAVAFPADCAGNMDKGFAVAVAKKWPAFAEAFKGKKLEVGDVFEWNEGELFVYALGVEKGGGKPKLSWLERALRATVEKAQAREVQRLLLPRMTGFDWTRVKRVVEELGKATAMQIVVFEQFVRDRPASSGDAT